MRQWLKQIMSAKYKAMPILSFPCIQLMGITVKDLISSADNQAKGMKLISEKVDSIAALSLMDLSLEAECFGSKIRFSDDEVPAVTDNIVTNMQSAQALKIPHINTGRTAVYIEAAQKAVDMINNKPVLAGTIGPFSLAARIVGVSDAMIYCYEEPDMMHTVLQKTSGFLTEYINEYKKAGVNGVVMAEPVTGMLSPDLAHNFSEPYVKKIIDEVHDDEFIIVYHNCGSAVIHMIDSLLAVNADAYHFGNAVEMAQVMRCIPQNIIAMGNISPAEQFRGGTPESVRKATRELLEQCGHYPNFVISSGCDIPPLSSWDNISAFFDTVKEFYL
jgi:uroporphyrinogen decarboxylase